MTIGSPPRIEGAPGLKWRKRRNGWEARWVPRHDIVKRGYPVPSRGIKVLIPVNGDWNTDEFLYIQDVCTRLQADMLAWAAGGVAQLTPKFDGTWRSLIRCFQTDPDSKYRKVRWRTKQHYQVLCRILDEGHTDERKDRRIAGHGEERIADTRTRHILRWHEEWSEGGKISMGHAMAGMVRMLLSFGAGVLEDDDCAKLKGKLSEITFSQGKPRSDVLTADHAIAIRMEAHRRGMPEIALGQAFQFECLLRQKDVIGEWVPMNEPVPPTDVHHGNEKWARGLQWQEIDQNLILTHVTSKRGKEIVIDLKRAPMVIEELERMAPGCTQDRSLLPAKGPVIVRWDSGLPYQQDSYRKWWKRCARAVGVPKGVRNMDSRAGGITEATDAGAPLEHVRQAATHSDVSLTQRYSRGAAEKIVSVQEARARLRSQKT